MTDTTRCESCTMPIESGTLCEHCTDENGALQPFDERFPRMVQWAMHQDASITREKAERQTIEFMATMPAWRDHPEVTARLKNT
ncbi:MAG TPA: hypothetical protein PKN33_05385 [Phycisphaerae bacterium]|nr:hypothetical protein [Phycisphaerae bacterium]